jgi:hypothetical protein
VLSHNNNNKNILCEKPFLGAYSTGLTVPPTRQSSQEEEEEKPF